ncbi:MAG: uracil-DNA glycosylase [Desulfuromonadales bacterium GWD2_61_12]|nr:MAG: uracil-DNA glycosylase [Desulfuromonadales bacterium GWC2_61_20]OGR36495.1 MAG: uracil-DNA glycosylase [Desulfuromonadales bacterium GWD2_61_12]HAD04025.1 uracil-DNA glycosylase [Desulfuromonas sp.]HBT81974.1 uracil-DNA glycosylase [Desulfuromonas sp.]
MSLVSAGLVDLVRCRRCSRLVDYLATLPVKRGFSRADYHAAPVAPFGDPAARVCLIGLAPGAHGANRTGRPFTGDGAGDFMYPLLHQAGFASQPAATSSADGLRLHDLYITNAVKCAPPGNKPTPAEFACCRPYLAAELAALPQLKVVLCLGREAQQSYLRLLQEQGHIARLADYPFNHGAVQRPGVGPYLVASYHTSRYNIQTRRLDAAMFLALLQQVRRLAGGENG